MPSEIKFQNNINLSETTVSRFSFLAIAAIVAAMEKTFKISVAEMCMTEQSEAFERETEAIRELYKLDEVNIPEDQREAAAKVFNECMDERISIFERTQEQISAYVKQCAKSQES